MTQKSFLLLFLFCFAFENRLNTEHLSIDEYVSCNFKLIYVNFV